jgi:DNA polymerase-1
MDSGEAVGSGRFSANDPSIQQSPKTWRWSTFLDVDPRNPEHWKEVVARSDFGEHYWEGNFRDFLIASPDSYLLTFDYSQIELRMLAGLAAEPYLIEAFKQRRDIHTATASLMLGMEESRVSSEDRSKGKTINFGIVFGMGAKLLAEQLAISVPEAEALLAQYMSAFTNVGDWIERQKRFGLAAGFVTTHFGRKVTLWDLQSQNFVIRGRGERLCVNAAVQGTAADAMKISMVKIRNAMERVGWWGKEVKMVNNVHDFLIFDVSNSVYPNVLREMLVPCVEWDV